jgi:hypothetical protein
MFVGGIDMNCRQVIERLYDLETGRLGADESERIRGHVKGCERCRRELDQIKEILALLDKAQAPDPSPGYQEKIRARLRQVQANVPVSARPLHAGFKEWLEEFFSGCPPLAAASALVAVLVLGIGYIAYRTMLRPEHDTIRRGGIAVRGPALEAEKPLEIRVSNVERAFEELSGLVEAYGGRIVRRWPIEGGKQILLRVPESEEKSFIGDLSGLGEITRPKSGYKDGEGNIVVIMHGPGDKGKDGIR